MCKQPKIPAPQVIARVTIGLDSAAGALRVPKATKECGAMGGQASGEIAMATGRLCAAAGWCAFYSPHRP